MILPNLSPAGDALDSSNNVPTRTGAAVAASIAAPTTNLAAALALPIPHSVQL
ncbi:MAG: hypothetical protein LBU02_03715 [Rickettsiales bacterium]|nr:hypothetical protein [Rickettsiales bacterium]